MKANPLGVAVFQPIVKLLVVAEVESLLLKLPLQIPICLGNKEEAGMCFLNGGDHIRPVLRWRAVDLRGCPRCARRWHSAQASPYRSGCHRTDRQYLRGFRSRLAEARAAKAFSCSTSGHAGKKGSRPQRTDCFLPHQGRMLDHLVASSALPRMKYSGCSATHG